jgi:hypothetical protein
MSKQTTVKTTVKSLALGGREDILKSLRDKKKSSFFEVVVRDREKGVGKKFARSRDRNELTFFEPVQVTTFFSVSFFFFFFFCSSFSNVFFKFCVYMSPFSLHHI